MTTVYDAQALHAHRIYGGTLQVNGKDVSRVQAEHTLERGRNVVSLDLPFADRSDLGTIDALAMQLWECFYAANAADVDDDHGDANDLPAEMAATVCNPIADALRALVGEARAEAMFACGDFIPALQWAEDKCREAREKAEAACLDAAEALDVAIAAVEKGDIQTVQKDSAVVALRAQIEAGEANAACLVQCLAVNGRESDRMRYDVDAVVQNEKQTREINATIRRMIWKHYKA